MSRPPAATYLRPTATGAWAALLLHAVAHGRETMPRGHHCHELAPGVLSFDMRHPVVAYRPRKLSYTYLAAEAVWIIDGDDRVETIAPYNPNIAQWSDDGVRFAGAYGPPFTAQVDWACEAIANDHDTRQAVITIWRPSPAPSKDIPCTVGLNFQLRAGLLHAHAFMRSNDLWLGTPYDVFTFTMMAARIGWGVNQVVRHRLNRAALRGEGPGCSDDDLPVRGLGWLTLTAASSHVYDRDVDKIGVAFLAHSEAELQSLDRDLDTEAQRAVQPLPDATILRHHHGWPALRVALIAARDRLPTSTTIDGVKAVEWTPRPQWPDRHP